MRGHVTVHHCNDALHGRPWCVHHSIMMNIMWQRFNQSAQQLVVGYTTSTFVKNWPIFTNSFTVKLHPFISLFSRTTWVSWYQKGKTSLDLNEAEMMGFGMQWHQLDHVQTIYTSLLTKAQQKPITQFLQAGCSSWRPTNSVKALKAKHCETNQQIVTVTQPFHILNCDSIQFFKNYFYLLLHSIIFLSSNSLTNCHKIQQDNTKWPCPPYWPLNLEF